MLDRMRKIMDFALEKERNAERFYRKWAGRAEPDDLRELLTRLALEERAHAEKLAGVKPEDLISEGSAPPDFHLSDELDDVEPSSDLSLIDALKLAIKREEKAISLYEFLRRSGRDAAPLFAALVEEERRHKHALEERYARLVRGLD